MRRVPRAFRATGLYKIVGEAADRSRRELVPIKHAGAFPERVKLLHLVAPRSDRKGKKQHARALFKRP